MSKFKLIRFCGRDCLNGDRVDTIFDVVPSDSNGTKWKARIKVSLVCSDGYEQTISGSVTDFDVLRAMEKVQEQLISSGLLCGSTIDITDELFNLIVADLESQFGFSLT